MSSIWKSLQWNKRQGNQQARLFAQILFARPSEMLNFCILLFSSSSTFRAVISKFSLALTNKYCWLELLWTILSTAAFILAFFQILHIADFSLTISKTRFWWISFLLLCHKWHLTTSCFFGLACSSRRVEWPSWVCIIFYSDFCFLNLVTHQLYFGDN